MVLDDVIIENVAVMASHFQGRVSHDLLKGKRIAAAVHQILPSKGVSECVDRSPLHASAVVVLHDCEPQSILCEEVPKLITEQIIRGSTFTNCHVISQDSNHRSTEGDDLNFAVLRVPENNLLSAQVYILILNVANCGSSTAAVQQKIHNDPITILEEIAFCFRLLQEDQKFFVSVDLLHRFGSLEDFDVQIGVSFLIALREEDLQCASVTVD